MLVENALYIFFNSERLCKCQHVAVKVLLKWFICNFYLTFKLHWILMPCKKKRCKGLRRLFSVTLCLSRNTSNHSYTHVTKLYYKNHTCHCHCIIFALQGVYLAWLMALARLFSTVTLFSLCQKLLCFACDFINMQLALLGSGGPRFPGIWLKRPLSGFAKDIVIVEGYSSPWTVDPMPPAPKWPAALEPRRSAPPLAT